MYYSQYRNDTFLCNRKLVRNTVLPYKPLCGNGLLNGINLMLLDKLYIPCTVIAHVLSAGVSLPFALKFKS